MLTHIRVQNVRHALSEGVHIVRTQGIREDSRNGPVLVMPGPLVTTYERPAERVLLDPQRDANPFFHLMEALWMLAGRNDVDSLMRFNAGMAKYSDNGHTFHGAYGHRWRHHFEGIDQLTRIIELLRANPADRRIVLQMWDPIVDLGREGLDFPCNNLCYFRVVDRQIGWADIGDDTVMKTARHLDMTIVCRSNDMWWGGYGANAVHFSVLQEFVASMVGVRVGEMHQLSNNAHLYLATLPPEGSLLPYAGYTEATLPLFGDLSAVPVAEVLQEFDTLWDDDIDGEVEHLPATTIQLFASMGEAWKVWKAKGSLASFVNYAEHIPHPDWRRACIEWGQRRSEKFK